MVRAVRYRSGDRFPRRTAPGHSRGTGRSQRPAPPHHRVATPNRPDDGAREGVGAMTHRLPPEIGRMLHGVLQEDAFDKWGNKRIERLGCRTPYEALDDGDYAAVLELVEGYSDPSFS